MYQNEFFFRMLIPDEKYFWDVCFRDHFSQASTNYNLEVTGFFKKDKLQDFLCLHGHLPHQLIDANEYWKNLDLYLKKDWIPGNHIV